jgi:hypothetical protein
VPSYLTHLFKTCHIGYKNNPIKAYSLTELGWLTQT